MSPARKRPTLSHVTTNDRCESAASPMFKHVLLATDGSEASSHAVDVAVELARASHGHLTTFHATPAFHPTEMHAHAVMREAQQEARHSREHARHAIGPVERR